MNSEASVNRHPSTLRTFLVAIIGLALFVLPSAASAAKPAPKPTPTNGQLSIAANPKQVTFSRAVAITGKLKGSPSAGQGVVLQVNPFPYAGFSSVGAAVTDANGNYSFSAKPTVNTRYRVVTTTISPAETSAEVTVPVSPRIGLSLSDRTPKSGRLVRFYGTVWPSHDGRTAQIQRRTTTGSWRTVARVTLSDDGETRSKYSRRIRIRSNGTFRVQLLAHVDHATGFSTTRFIRVH